MKLAYQLQTEYIRQAQVQAQAGGNGIPQQGLEYDEQEEGDDEEGIEANGEDDEDFYDPRQNPNIQNQNYAQRSQTNVQSQNKPEENKNNGQQPEKKKKKGFGAKIKSNSGIYP